jgi:hypothetical protein
MWAKKWICKYFNLILGLTFRVKPLSLADPKLHIFKYKNVKQNTFFIYFYKMEMEDKPYEFIFLIAT